jgi:hypothetical protein
LDPLHHRHLRKFFGKICAIGQSQDLPHSSGTSVPLSNKQNYWPIEFSNRLTAWGFFLLEFFLYLSAGTAGWDLDSTDPRGMATVAMPPLTVVSAINSLALIDYLEGFAV